MKYCTVFGGAALGAALCATTAFAQQEKAEAPAVEPPAVHAMKLEDGRLTGPGADLILARLPKAQFVLLGEEHGFADAPHLALALARAGRRYGLHHHVIETGPLSEEWVSRLLKKGDVDALGNALGERPIAIPFLTMREDAELVAWFLENAPRRADAVWGVDQEFIGSPLIHFETLGRLAPNGDAKALAQSRLTAERKAFASGNQGALFMFSASAEDFAKLRDAFRKSGEAMEIIGALEESAAIYQAFGQGRNYASNADRIALIRRQFLEPYLRARGDAPRVLFKMGAIHLGRGTTFLNTFDLGSLTEGIAAGNGLEVLRIAYMPLAGRMTKVTPFAESAYETEDFRAEAVAGFLKSIGLSDDRIAENGFTVLPLGPLRRALEQKGLGQLSEEMRFFVLGFDFLVTTRGAKPATPLAK